MLVLTAPNTEDPRDDGFVCTIPGELVTRPGIICDAGRDGTGCETGCDRSWAGITSRKGTTIAVVAERPDLTHATYVAMVAASYRDVWEWDEPDATDEAEMLAELAEHFGAGAFVKIEVHDSKGHCFDRLEV
jgi:hypothetical protein